MTARSILQGTPVLVLYLIYQASTTSSLCAQNDRACILMYTYVLLHSILLE